MVAGAVILVTIHVHVHQVNLIPPLTNQSRSWANSGYADNGGIASFFERQTELAKSFASTCAERSECLLLNPVSEDRNHQVPSQAGRGIGMEQVFPEITQLRFAHSGQGCKALFNRFRHRKSS